MPLEIRVLVHGQPGVTEQTFMEYMKVSHPFIHPNSPEYAAHRQTFYTGAWATLGWAEERNAENVIGEVYYYIQQRRKIIGKG